MRKVLEFYSPLLLLVLLIMLFSLYIVFHPLPACARVFGVNLSFLGIVIYLLVFPFLWFLVSLYAFIIGYRSLKLRSFPPASIPGLGFLPSFRGLTSFVISIALMATPIFSICIFWVGTFTFFTLLQGFSIADFQLQMESGCGLT